MDEYDTDSNEGNDYPGIADEIFCSDDIAQKYPSLIWLQSKYSINFPVICPDLPHQRVTHTNFVIKI